MNEYPKIETLYDRDPKTFKVIVGAWRCPEFAYLKDNEWLWTEKVDGTNVRVMWDREEVRFGGRSDNAQMPTFLLARLQELFTAEKMKAAFPEGINICLYGEGYGSRIQKVGSKYKADAVDFVLIDVKVDTWWLERPDIEDVAFKLGVGIVPVVGQGTLAQATEVVRRGFESAWGNFLAEGLVVRPLVSLFTRAGGRVVSKIKTKDF